MEIIQKILDAGSRILSDTVGGLWDLVSSWRDSGVSDEEIAKRLDDPSIVLQAAQTRAEKRRKDGEDYLGRSPR